MSTPGLYQMLKFSHLIGIRLAYPFVAYFILSVSDPFYRPKAAFWPPYHRHSILYWALRLVLHLRDGELMSYDEVILLITFKGMEDLGS